MPPQPPDDESTLFNPPTREGDDVPAPDSSRTRIDLAPASGSEVTQTSLPEGPLPTWDDQTYASARRPSGEHTLLTKPSPPSAGAISVSEVIAAVEVSSASDDEPSIGEPTRMVPRDEVRAIAERIEAQLAAEGDPNATLVPTLQRPRGAAIPSQAFRPPSSKDAAESGVTDPSFEPTMASARSPIVGVSGAPSTRPRGEDSNATVIAVAPARPPTEDPNATLVPTVPGLAFVAAFAELPEADPNATLVPSLPNASAYARLVKTTATPVSDRGGADAGETARSLPLPPVAPPRRPGAPAPPARRGRPLPPPPKSRTTQTDLLAVPRSRDASRPTSTGSIQSLAARLDPPVASAPPPSVRGLADELEPSIEARGVGSSGAPPKSEAVAGDLELPHAQPSAAPRPRSAPPGGRSSDVVDVDDDAISLTGSDISFTPGGDAASAEPLPSDVVQLDEGEVDDVDDDTATDMKPPAARPAAATKPPAQALEVELLGEDDEGDGSDMTEVGKPLVVPITPPAYTPPKADPTHDKPLHRVDADEEEERLARAKSWEALIELYLTRIERAPSWPAKAKLFARIASVFEVELDDVEQAFDALLEGFDLGPGDEDVAAGIERLAPKSGRIGQALERGLAKLTGALPDTRGAILARLTRWYEIAGRADVAKEYLAELENVDWGHPLVLFRNAQAAAQRGDAKGQREAIERALDRMTRRDEKVDAYLKLSQIRGGRAEDALKALESAYRLAPTSFPVLAGLERAGAALERYGLVEWALEEQVKHAPRTEDKVAALMRHAELLERRFFKREVAAQKLEHVIRLTPSSGPAMAALERCYHAQRAWPELARAIERRAEQAQDPRVRVDLLAKAAEVLELKVNDPAGAALILKRALAGDGKNKRVLGDLARLSEKAQSYGDVVTYKTKLAEIAPSKRAASQIYVQIGELLNAPDRDPVGARLMFEKAVELDRTHAAAWEALEKIVRGSGDDRRLMQCLEERAKHTDAPRLRAQVLVELAALRRTAGDERAATQAYEAALKADPSNEAAARQVIDALVAQSRWAEALPLADLLVSPGARERDPEGHYGRLRIATKIALGKGDLDRALTWAIGQVDARDDDSDAWMDLLEVTSRLRDSKKKATIDKALAAVARMEGAPIAMDADMFAKLGQVQLSMGNTARALRTFARAIDLDASHVDAMRGMVEACLLQQDWAGACDCKVALARTAASLDEKFTHLCEAGEIWAHRARELGEAERVWAEALTIKPRDHWLLHSLMWLFGETENWERLVEVLAKIAEIQESPERRAKSLYARAQVIAEKMSDELAAARAFDDVLETDPARLEAFEQIVRLLTSRKDWWELERAYRKMIGRAKDAPLTFALFKQLGLVYRDRLGDGARALEAFEAAERVRSDDPELRKMKTELYVVSDQLDKAVEHVRTRIDDSPHDAALYGEIYELFLRQQQFDKAWCAVNVLGQLQELSPEQAQFHADYPPFGLGDIPGRITEEAWQSHLLAGLDLLLTGIFAWMTPAVARARHALLPPEQMVLTVGRPFTSAHSQLADVVKVTFRDAAEILGIPMPDLLAAPSGSAGQPLAAALSPFGAVYVQGPGVEARADTLTFLIGKRLAEQRVELCARAFFPTVSELTTLLATAVRVANGSAGRDPQFLPFDGALMQRMTPQERDGVRQLVGRATHEGRKLDVKRWSQTADLASTRAGLLLAGDVGGARRSIQKEPQSSSDRSPREKIGDLFRFAISDEYADLRGAVGIAVGAEG